MRGPFPVDWARGTYCGRRPAAPPRPRTGRVHHAGGGGAGTVVDFDKAFIGSDALLNQQYHGTRFTLVGLQMPGRSAPRATYALTVLGFPAGQVTSGCYSPTLDMSLGMGYVFPEYSRPGTVLELDKRGLIEEITVTGLPHYRRPRPSRASQPA